MCIPILLLLEREIPNNSAQLREEEVKGGFLGDLHCRWQGEREKHCSDCAGSQTELQRMLAAVKH